MTSSPRLLAINNYFYRRGGAESVFLDQIDLFAAAGWEVVPFAMRHPANLPSAWSDYFVSEIEYGEPGGPLTKIGRAAKVIYSLEARRKIRALIGRVPPTVAHAHNVYHHISPSIFGALKAEGVPLVMTAHDLKVACPAYKMLSQGRVCERCQSGRIHNVLLRRCVKDSAVVSGLVLLETLVHRSFGLYRDTIDRLIAPSRFYRDKLIEWGWDAGRIAYLPNCIDTRQYSPAAHEGDYVVYAGRLAPEKGLATLVRAAALARQRLVLAGSGPEESALRRLAGEVDADVAFTGHLDKPALQRLIGEARALILPSEWYENAPISVLEAYALGRPVIGTRIGGIPELILDGETGALVEPGNAAMLAEALATFASISPSVRAGFGAAGRNWVAWEFSPDRYRDRTMALYEALR
ncbi:MAG: glycosyltransferase family 4 protein [Bosea sp.]|uniref:glycosyltransferase family 4 protein n=1 Tax=Bosea sp. (in: a-proteobacteria) TaxID=1871050 RepID=UPI00239974F0|nr:glycosyltransferase family 4 protein [Bosea sp. (in: a-proteobacteria)]MCP4739539.1 glycosyltransferase family 4 protein [Bosea sp. (in: a-proteobacteria)]